MSAEERTGDGFSRQAHRLEHHHKDEPKVYRHERQQQSPESQADRDGENNGAKSKKNGINTTAYRKDHRQHQR